VTGATHSSGNDFTVNAVGGTFHYNPTITSDTLTLAGNANTNIQLDGPLTFQTTGNISVDEVLEGAGGLVKTDGNTLTLNGANLYSGATAVNAGTLLVNNTAGSGLGAGNVGVTGGILGGTGAFTGTATIGSGASLSPGASIESLASGALTMNGSSTFVFEAANNTSTGADLMVVNGALSLTGVNLDLTNANLAAGSWVMGDKLSLINYGSTGITSGFNGYANNTAYAFGSNSWLFKYDDTTGGNNFASEATNANFVTLTMVPEPGTFAMLLFGAMYFFAVGRKRRASCSN
jgi:autotransporter-associated beta strand protein